MAATNYTPISLYYSTTAAAVPVNTNLVNGELAINITDGKLYYKNAGGTVTLLASTAGASGDVVGPASSTDNALARFDLATGKLIQNSVGILSDAGVLTGLTGLTSSGSITLSSLTSGRVTYAGASGLLQDSANLLFNGTTLTANTLNLTNALGTTYGGTGLSSFTSGGVVYASSSSALSTGSVLTFDGSNLGLGVTPSAWGSGWPALQVFRTVMHSNTSDGRASFGNNYYVDGTNARYIATAAATQLMQVSGEFRFFNAPSGTAGNAITFTQALTLDASGRLLVGDTSAVSSLASGTLQVGSGIATIINTGSLVAPTIVTSGSLDFNFDGVSGTQRKGRITGNGTTGGGAYAGGLDFEYYAYNGSTYQWYTGVRLDSSGNLLVGTTSQPLGTYRLVASTNGTGAAGGALFVSDQATTGNESFSAWHTATSGNNTFCYFGTEATFTIRGSITYNRASGLTVYNTTSDYRAKDIIGPIQDSGATIDALKVYEGQMKGATQSRPMLVAHEAQAVTPYAVTGEKDAVKEDGTPDYQQMDVSSLVPLLIAEIQSLRIRITQLEAQ